MNHLSINHIIYNYFAINNHMNCHIDNFMPQYFESKVMFNAKTKLDVQIQGKGLNQVILKFLLPELPCPLKYKAICVYDLIKKITLRIGGKIFLKHYSIL